MTVSPASAELPTVSVLLPAWNEEDALARCLDSLLALDWPDLEVIVCAGGTDNTLAIARQYERATCPTLRVLVQNPGEGKQVALRRCFEQSRGDVIYLTDADCVVPQETLEQLVKAVGPARADAATGPAEPFPEQRDRAWIRHQWATNRAVDRHRPRESTGILGRNCAVRRESVEMAGAFQEPVRIGTDYHFAKSLLAAGCTIWFVPAPVQTQFAEALGPYTDQQSRWLRNILLHGTQFGANAEIAAVSRTIVIGWTMVAMPFTWRWTKAPGVLVWGAMVSWMARVRIMQQRDLEAEMDLTPSRARWLHATLFTLADLLVWAKPALDLISARRRFRW
jgi:hypothetical protein